MTTDIRRQDRPLFEAVRAAAKPLEPVHDYQAVPGLVGDAHFVLQGEASHGTRESRPLAHGSCFCAGSCGRH